MSDVVIDGAHVFRLPKQRSTSSTSAWLPANVKSYIEPNFVIGQNTTIADLEALEPGTINSYYITPGAKAAVVKMLPNVAHIVEFANGIAEDDLQSIKKSMPQHITAAVISGTTIVQEAQALSAQITTVIITGKITEDVARAVPDRVTNAICFEGIADADTYNIIIDFTGVQRNNITTIEAVEESKEDGNDNKTAPPLHRKVTPAVPKPAP